MGEKVALLTDRDERAGRSGEIVFDASNLKSGAYFVVLEAGNYRESAKMVVMK